MSPDDAKPSGGGFLDRPSSPGSIFTPEDLGEEQQAIARLVDAFWKNEVEPALPAIHRLEPGAARRVLRKAADLGLMAASIPEEYGGMELGLTSTLVIAERVARDGSYMMWEGGQTLLGALPILYFGSSEQRARYLPKLASVEMLAAYALSEAQSGSDALSVRTRADLNPEGTHYILNGQKMWITNGSEADLFIVFAKIDGERFTAFLVERSFPGVTTGPNEHKMGLRGSSTTALFLDDVPVPAGNLLGEPGRGHVIAFNILNLGRLKLGASGVGAAKDVLQLSIRYANRRRAFGSSISAFGAIRHKLAEMAIRIFAAESIVWRTAGMIEEPTGGVDRKRPGTAAARLEAIREFAVECSMVKVFGSEMLDYVVDEGVQIHGGYGFHEDYKVERAYRDSRINRIFEGTNEINRLLIPRMLSKRGIGSGARPASLRSDAAVDERISTVKALGLWCLHLAGESRTGRVEAEQEARMHVADILIDAYAIESSVLRARKIEASGRESNATLIASVFLADAVARVEFAATRVVLRCSEAANREDDLEVVRRATSAFPLDTIGARRKIAEKLIEHECYAI